MEQLTTKEAAEILGIDPRSVVRAIQRRRISASKRGRDYLILRSEVERYRVYRLGSGPTGSPIGTPEADQGSAGEGDSGD